MSVTAVILPKLGLTMDEGTLVAWLKKEGDRVEAGEILFEVETDKATMEVESPVAGYVRRLLAAAGETVPVTQVIALISATADEPMADQPVGRRAGGGRLGASSRHGPSRSRRPPRRRRRRRQARPSPGRSGSSRVPRPASGRWSSAWTWPGSVPRRAAGSRSRTSRRRRIRPRREDVRGRGGRAPRSPLPAAPARIPAVADAPGDRRADDTVVPRRPPVLGRLATST